MVTRLFHFMKKEMKTKKLLFGLLMFVTSAVFLVGCDDCVPDPKIVVLSVYFNKDGEIISEVKPDEAIFVDDMVKVCIDKDPGIEIGTVDLSFDGDNEVIEEFPYVYKKMMTTEGMHTIIVDASTLTADPGNVTIASRTFMRIFYVNKR